MYSAGLTMYSNKQIIFYDDTVTYKNKKTYEEVVVYICLDCCSLLLQDTSGLTITDKKKLN